MALVATLDLAYFWVDRLCIVQDDVAEKQAQLEAMGAIYAQSYVTIIAAQSHDATGPLSSRPLSLISTPIWTKYRNFIRPDWDGLRRYVGKALGPPATKTPGLPTNPWIRPRENSEVMNIMAADLVGTVWFSRGWTFQEYLFSRRKIAFHNNTVN